MISDRLSTSPVPAEVEASGFDLPALYVECLRRGWKLAPWRFLRGEEFLDTYRRINAALGVAPPTTTVLALPLAVNDETRTALCIQSIPSKREVLIVQLQPALETIAILPSFDAWLRLAVEDVIRSVDAPASSPAREFQPPRPPEPVEPTPDARSSTRRHLLRVLRESEIDHDFVAAEAGDQPMTSPSVRRHHERVRAERGDRLYADMLFVLTQHRYPPRMAKWLWTRILQHKDAMSRDLERPVEITVASLDFLNQHAHLVEGSLVLCSEDELAQVADVALRDGLTGLFDQATFRARLERELQRVDRYECPLSLVLLDLDHFKQLNDQHGHLTGDEVLSSVGKILRQELRAVDFAARYGGEEFAVVLPQTGPGEAFTLAERLRRSIEERFAGDLQVTASFGVATCPDVGADVSTLIEAADQALYASKSAGRNQVTRAKVTTPTQ